MWWPRALTSKADARRPTLPEIAAYCRQRRMACVVFPVDAEAATGQPPVPNEVAEAAAAHSDVLVISATVITYIRQVRLMQPSTRPPAGSAWRSTGGRRRAQRGSWQSGRRSGASRYLVTRRFGARISQASISSSSSSGIATRSRRTRIGRVLVEVRHREIHVAVLVMSDTIGQSTDDSADRVEVFQARRAWDYRMLSRRRQPWTSESAGAS